MKRGDYHLYRNGLDGRSLASAHGVGGASFTLGLTCSQCPKVGQLKCGKVLPDKTNDEKFRRAGWRLDPNICPDCIRKAAQSKGNPMASNPSPAAVKVQASMFKLLYMHFDGETGRYAKGWSDKEVAAKAGAALDLVIAVRSETFGELKEPSEISALRSEISALEGLVSEQIASLRTELAKVAKAYA